MTTKQRMSPLTAFFLGLFGVGTAIVCVGGVIAIFGMRLVDKNVNNAAGLVATTIANVPELIDSLPPIVSDSFKDRRAPEYASHLDVKVTFVPDGRGKGYRPALSITNRGEEMISLLGIRVAAMDERDSPIADWTEVVATPISIDNHWRGPLMAGQTRNVVLSGWYRLSEETAAKVTGAWEITDVRIWDPSVKTADAGWLVDAVADSSSD
jgi:hypothetical protein